MEKDYKKLYCEALQKAKHALDCHRESMCNTDVSLIESMFPELKKSDDERIRESLVKAVEGVLKNATLFGTDVTREEALSWLEKHKDENEAARRDIASSINIFLNYSGKTIDYVELTKVLEDAILMSDWHKMYNIMKNRLEKQDEINDYFNVPGTALNGIKELNKLA